MGGGLSEITVNWRGAPSLGGIVDRVQVRASSREDRLHYAFVAQPEQRCPVVQGGGADGAQGMGLSFSRVGRHSNQRSSHSGISSAQGHGAILARSVIVRGEFAVVLFGRR